MEVRTKYLLWVAILLAVGLFTLDLLLPLGVAVEAAYAAVVLISCRCPRSEQIWGMAILCTVLTLASLLLSPPSGHLWVALINRLLGVFLIWVSATLGPAAFRTTQLEVANALLEKEVRERRRAEERIREQAALLDQVPDAIIIRDLNDRICFWNHGAERIYGWTAAEVLGQNANTLLFHESQQELRAAQEAAAEGGQWTGETRQVTRDGREVIAETRWVVLRDERGHPRAKLVVNTDITARKKLEAQLLRSQRLESIGTLVGGIAHDFNNLLTPILMGTKLLLRNRPELDRQRLLETIQASAERGAEVVRQLLDFAGGSEGRFTIVQPTAVTAEIRTILEHALPKSIQVRAHLSADLWPVQADVTQLSQVLMNLCVNARDAMPTGGTLTIAAQNVVLTDNLPRLHPDAQPGKYVVLAVGDTGTGIAPEVFDKIFDPFFTTKGHGRGTGLGLSTVVGIVKGHGGFLDVQTTVGKGSCFQLYLPAVLEPPTSSLPLSPPQGAAPGNAPPTSRTERGGILVVDDEAAIREMVQATLEGNGYQVRTANDGSEALAIYEQFGHEIRVVVLDMMMPVLDGAATIEALQRLNPQVRIIASSGRQTAIHTTELVEGRGAFLLKPYTSEQLLAILEEVLG